MANKLSGKRIAILAADGVEQAELTEPRKALEAERAKTELVSPAKGQVQAFQHPDQLRMLPKAVDCVRSFFDRAKPVAAICHAPWLLVEADVVRGKTLTSWPSLQTDIRNAGAKWVDREVVEDEGLVTSRKPDDIPAFNKKMIELFSHDAQPEPQRVGPAQKLYRT